MTTEFTMILFVLIGLIIGFIAGRSTSRAGDAAKLQKELTKTRKEFDQYKRDVQDHFTNFTNLMDQLNHQYQRMSQQLTEQGEKLVGTPHADYPVQPDVPVEDTEHEMLNKPVNSGVHQPLDYSGQPSGLLNDKKS